MCGIAGVFRFQEPRDDIGVVRAMTVALERRGPDDQGIEQEDMLTLGNRRLAILDLSDAGHQPMRSANGRYLISFNGEIYNYKDIRDELGLDPGSLRSSTDTEIILHAWQRWGPGCLDRLVGQWAFALYDKEDRYLWLTRDRFGEKPIFYHQSPSQISFSSSIPSLFEAPWVSRELNDEALVEYLTMRYVVAPRTIVSGINKLPGGHWLRAGADGVEIERWYTPHFKTRPNGQNRAALVEEFDRLFSQASARCLESDVPIALLLSDGIDSNSILAALTEQKREIRSFTFALTGSASGLEQARHSHGNGPVAMDLLVTPAERLEKMIPAFSSFTEPVGDGAALATWLLIRNARDQATVFLCGHGGDEVLGGYRLSQDRFRLSLLRRLARLPEPWVSRLIDRHVYGSEPIELKRRSVLDAPPRKTPAAARYMIHRPLPPNDLTLLLGSEGDDRYLGTVDRLYERCLEEAADLDRMQEVMLHTFLSENILTFADSVAMDSSAELRMPFLDRDLIEFILSLPPSMRVGGRPGRTNTKRILRWWSKGRVPRDVVTRRKRAFPFGNLPDLLATDKETIRNRIVDNEAVRRAVPGVDKWLDQPPAYFRGPWEGTLWALLSLGIWAQAHGLK